MSTPETVARQSTPSAQAGAQRRHNEGHGRRLTAAFEALEAFPALAESRNRLLRLVSQERVSAGDVVAAVESDCALVISVLRLANQVEGRSRGRVESVVKAVELLSPEAVQALASRARTYDFFERSSVWDAAPERFRLHGVATQRAADRLATETGYEDRDRLMVTALLHDIGKLVLRSEEHTSELQSRQYLVCRLLLEKKKTYDTSNNRPLFTLTPSTILPLRRPTAVCPLQRVRSHLTLTLSVIPLSSTTLPQPSSTRP